MKAIVAASIIWALVIGLIIAVGLCSRRHKPLLVDATPAASTHCVKPHQPCGPNCVRLIANRSVA